eukprot:TRINITY_DN5357_c0_g2_i1.p1 TRINITY_DN5357_c0_g2~~TRINITY_DN5357_c0_g2_i1.p1  ORF type:complete len:173 (+),score=25.53 TRINITY_DN5357_c0_g2_i1:64-519(+)
MRPDEANQKMLLSPIDQTLRLVYLKTESIDTITHSLLKVLLSPSNFFSFTRSGDEITLVIDESALEALNTESTIQIHPVNWKVIQVELGSGGFEGPTGVVTILSEALAEKEISVYYLSTINNDFILVQEHAVNAAIECLVSQNLAIWFPEK